MSHLEKEKQKLIAHIKRIRGQVDSIERSLTHGDDCADVLMLLANVRGGINSLMAEVSKTTFVCTFFPRIRTPLRLASWPKTRSILLWRTSSKGVAFDKMFSETSVGQSKVCLARRLKFDL